MRLGTPGSRRCVRRAPKQRVPGHTLSPCPRGIGLVLAFHLSGLGVKATYRAVPDTPGEPCLRGGRSSRGPCPSTVPALAGDSGIVVTLPLATYRYFTMIQETLTHRSGSSDCIVDTMRLFGGSLPFARGKPVGAHTRRLLKIFSLHLCISDGMCRISSSSPGARPAGWKVTAEGQFRVAAAAGWQLLRAGVAGRPAAGRAASFRLPRPPAANRPHPRSRPGLRPSGC